MINGKHIIFKSQYLGFSRFIFFFFFAVDTAGQYLQLIALLTFIAETLCFF